LWPLDVFKGKVVYIIGEVDAIIPPQLGEAMIEKVNKLVPGRVKTIRIKDGGHATHVTKPEIVAGLIEDLAAELQN
jgi:pimeloyl-ACP methyl ester carboxylesterase